MSKTFRLAGDEGSTISASTAVSLLVPGVVGSALAAPASHDFTITLLYPTRFLLSIASLASYGAAVVVAFDLHGRPALFAWAAVVSIAFGPAIPLSRQFWRLRRADAQDRQRRRR